jgi:hypothetical protein
MIVFADHGYYILKAHEDAFRDGNAAGHREMYEWLLGLMNGEDPDADYDVIEIYDIHNNKIYLMLRND